MAQALVLGAGIVGITMAYELWRDGHEVTVVDREDGAAEFTSFRQCRHDCAGPCLCVGVGRSTLDPDEVAVAK
jgi:D-amino-acid dehydrogenase